MLCIIIHYNHFKYVKKMLIDLQSIYEVIEVSGADAAQFLQGQLTCDINNTAKQQVIWGAHCNIKGRVVGLFRLIRYQQNFFLIVSYGLADKLIQTLGRYIFRSKVSLSLTNYQCYGLLQHRMKNCPENHYIKKNNDYYLNLPDQRILKLSHRIPDETQSDTNPWKRIGITLNEPQLYQSTCEVFLPNELALDILNGISFTKGCYIGQEIIARMHYLGKAKKSICQITHKDFAKPGTIIFQDTQDAGQIITSAKFNDGYISLASLKKNLTPLLYLDKTEKKPIHLYNT